MRVDRIDRLAWLVRDELTKAELEKITDQLTLFSEDMVSHELVKLQLYENQGSRIGVPRQYVKKSEFDKSSAIDCTIYGPPIDWPPFLGELHEGQFDSVQDIFDHLMSDGYGCILQAKCGCLSAGSIINVNRCGKGFKIRLDEMWNRWNVPNRYKWDRSDKTFIRSFNGECIVKNEVVDVKYSGRKLVYLVKLENGKALRATGDHKFLTTEGYIPVSKLVKYDLHVLCDELRPIMSGAKQKFSDPRVAVGVFHPYARKQTISTVIEVHRAIFEAHLNGLSLEEFLLKTRIDAGLEYVNPSEFVIHHSNGDHFDNRIENLVKLTHAEHRKVHRKDSIKNLNTLSFSKVKSVSISGVAETYDIICSDPFRNFVANGIVVHNSGKTITCLNIVGRLGLPTLVLVHKSDLMDQWEESIKKFYGLRTSQIGRIHQDTQRFKGYPITVALFQSINARQDELQAQGFFDWFSVVVIDEVQHIGARTFEMVIKLFPAKLRIGLTATPRRKDGLERVFAWHVGDIATRMKSVSVTGDFTQIRYNDPKLKYKSGDNMAKAITLLSQDVKRNILLVKWIMEASDRDRNVIVLTDRIEHATLLMGYVRLAQINGGKFASVALYVGGMKKEQLEESKKAKIIFGSYGMLGEGTNMPDRDTLFLATPRGDVEQVVGRIQRKHEGKKPIIVFDVVDTGLGLFIGLGRKRQKMMLSMGFNERS